MEAIPFVDHTMVDSGRQPTPWCARLALSQRLSDKLEQVSSISAISTACWTTADAVSPTGAAVVAAFGIVRAVFGLQLDSAGNAPLRAR